MHLRFASALDRQAQCCIWVVMCAKFILNRPLRGELREHGTVDLTCFTERQMRGLHVPNPEFVNKTPRSSMHFSCAIKSKY